MGKGSSLDLSKLAVEMNIPLAPRPLMILGTSSGVGKSLISAAVCRVLLRKGEVPLPFKGQNMSNNAWVDKDGGEMAYSQALQAWAAGLEPKCEMNPVLLKPKGDSTSEVIHLGKSVGIAKSETYYEEWFKPGWAAIRQGLKQLRSFNKNGRFVLEGAGSPVEVNLQKRDLTNLRLAQFLRANCLLVADIERGGVFAQLMGTLALLRPVERSLIKGLLINRFRGRRELFDEGRQWLEGETGIPVLGVLPWLKEVFPPEDSLDLLERRARKVNTEINIAVIKLPSISNFSDLDPLVAEPSVQLNWVELGESLGDPDAVIIPGSKQTLRDLEQLNVSGLSLQIKDFAYKGGVVFGICGGMQMLGRSLEDPFHLEHSTSSNPLKKIPGLNLLPIHTVFEAKKLLLRREVMMTWPEPTLVLGFELHHGKSHPLEDMKGLLMKISEDQELGWGLIHDGKCKIGGTYLHGIFDNGAWRRLWLNQLRREKGLRDLSADVSNHSERREQLIDLLADTFEKYVYLDPLLKK